MPVTARFIPSPADVERYRRLRALAPRFNGKIVETIPKEAMYDVANALGILKKRKIVFRTEDETSVLMDCCAYDWLQEGKNLVQKFAENHDPEAGTPERELLQGCLRAKYRMLLPESRVDGAGAWFRDIFTREEIFIMDFGLSQVPMTVALATRTLPMGEFWITGGAGLPAGLNEFRAATKSLNDRGLLAKDGFTDEHKAALLCVRTLLKHDVSEHVKYQNLDEDEEDREPEVFGRIAPSALSRNSPCPCGSGKRFKRCCGSRV